MLGRLLPVTQLSLPGVSAHFVMGVFDKATRTLLDQFGYRFQSKWFCRSGMTDNRINWISRVWRHQESPLGLILFSDFDTFFQFIITQ